jgi:uncharacterized protein (TIGR02246 family)
VEVPEIVRTYADAFASFDLERCIATFAPDGTFSDPNNPEPIARDQIEEYFKALYARYPDAQYEVLSLDAVSEGVCVTRWLTRTGSHEGSQKAQRATICRCASSSRFVAASSTTSRATTTD